MYLDDQSGAPEWVTVSTGLFANPTHRLHQPERNTAMQIDKQQILDLIKNKAGGGSEQATQAEQDLPDQVDTDQHADLLGKLGINPQDLLGKLGGLGGKLGM